MKNSVLFLWISVFVTQFFYANAESPSNEDSKFSMQLEEMGYMLGSSFPESDSYIIYNIIAQGFPKNKALDLSFSSWNVSNNKYERYSLFIDNSGQLMNLQTFENGDPIGCTPFFLVIKNPAYAEQIYCSLTIMGQTQGTQTTIVPFPIESRFANQKVSLSVSNSEERIYRIKGTGFKPFTKVTIDLFNDMVNENKTFKTFTDANGDFFKGNVSIPHYLKVRVTDENGHEIYIDRFDKYPSKQNWYIKPKEKINYSVSFKMINEEPPLYTIQGAGFEPNQLITFHINSWQYFEELYEHAGSDGTFCVYLPDLDYNDTQITVICDDKYIATYPSKPYEDREPIRLFESSSK